MATRWRCSGPPRPLPHPKGLAELILSEIIFFTKILILRNMPFQMHFINFYFQSYFRYYAYQKLLLIFFFLFKHPLHLIKILTMLY